jgi:selenocysteine-specific elongation factor
VEGDLVDLAGAEIEELLADGPYGGSRIIRVSSLTGEGLGELREALTAKALSIRREGGESRFRMPVDRIFTLQGHGVIVAGTVLSGSVSSGDTLELQPGARSFRVREMRVNETRTTGPGTAGDRVALNLVGLEKDLLTRGSVVAAPGWLAPTTTVDAELSMLPAHRLEPRQRVRFHCGAAEVMARAIPMSGETMRQGSGGFVHLQLEEPVVVVPGDRFVVRRFSPVTTIGGGVVLESGTAKVRSRNREERVKRVTLLAGGDMEGFLAERLEERPFEGIQVSEVAREVGRPDEEIRAAVQKLADDGIAVTVKDGMTARLVHGSAWERAAADIEGVLSSYHDANPYSRGMPMGQTGKHLQGLPQWLLKARISSMLESGAIRREGERFALGSFDPELDARSAARLEELVRAVDSAGFAGAPPPGDTPALEAMLERGMLIELEKGLLTTPAAAGRAALLLREVFGDREFRMGEMREAMGVSRKTAVLWAELLDSRGVTGRRGDLRVLVQGS